MSTLSWSKRVPLISVGTLLNPLLESDSRSQTPSHFLAMEKLRKEFVYLQLLYLANNHGWATSGREVRGYSERHPCVASDRHPRPTENSSNHTASDKTCPCCGVCHFISFLWSCRTGLLWVDQGQLLQQGCENDTLDTATHGIQVHFWYFLLRVWGISAGGAQLTACSHLTRWLFFQTAVAAERKRKQNQAIWVLVSKQPPPSSGMETASYWTFSVE